MTNKCLQTGRQADRQTTEATQNYSLTHNENENLGIGDDVIKANTMLRKAKKKHMIIKLDLPRKFENFQIVCYNNS